VRRALFSQVRGLVAKLSEDHYLIDDQMARKTRDKLVNSCKLAASLLHFDIFTVDDVVRVLQHLGVLHLQRRHRVDGVSVEGCRSDPQARPKAAMALSGHVPSTQPADGESMSAWRERLAYELNVPPERLGVLAGDSQVPLEACLDDFVCTLQVLIRHVDIKEEYRIEAASTLLLKAMPDLLASETGRDLLRQVLARWQQIRPRAIKLINSVSTENMADTAQRFVDLGFPWTDSEASTALADLLVSASASHGFYSACYGQLLCVLSSRCETSSLADARKASACGDIPAARSSGQNFLSGAKRALFSQVRGLVAKLSEDHYLIDDQMARKTRDKLVTSFNRVHSNLNQMCMGHLLNCA
jgi:hypothetical protein